ncbi:hypothetical protein B0O99DRAFT_499742 [Bisporella sp. PMI_857]|nr:hypothetical protein B0O99DRAFT_499742 [Bisporella sp. PMI_857]
MAASKSSLSVHITITVAPENVDKFLEALRPTFEAVTREPLNTFFEVYHDPKKPGVFKLVEHWDADVGYMMGVQLKKDYYKPYHAVVDPLFLKPLEVEIYSRFPGNEWASVRKEAYPGRDWIVASS